MKLFLSTLVLLLALEGSLFAAFPEMMRKCLEEGGRSSARSLRGMGISCILLALLLGLLLKYTGTLEQI